MALRLKYWLVTVLFVVALASAMEGKAFGYVDPGSSLLAFQSVSALASGLLFYFRRRIKAMFTKSEPASVQGSRTTLDRR